MSRRRKSTQEDEKVQEMYDKQSKTFKIWCNQILKKSNEKINDLSIDLKDGIILYKMITTLANIPLQKVKKGTNKFQCLVVHNKYLEILNQQKVKIVNISAEDIYDCNKKLILGLVWTLIQFYQIKHLNEINSTESENLSNEDIIKSSIGKLLNMEAKDLKVYEDFKDGLLLCRLVNSKAVNSIPNWQTLKPESALENVTLSFMKAEEHLNVPQMLEPIEIVTSKFDKNSFLTYLSSVLISEPCIVELPPSEKTAEIIEIEEKKEISVLEFEINEKIFKNKNGNLLLNFNGIQIKNAKNKFFLISDKSIECEFILQDHGIAQIKFKDLPNGEYEGILESNSETYVTNKKIVVNHSYEPKIKLFYEEREYFENAPIKILIDISDFDSSSLEIKGIDFEEPKIIYSLNQNLKCLIFIPTILEKYELKFSVNNQHKTISFNIKKVDKSNYFSTQKYYKSFYGAPNLIAIRIPEKENKSGKIFTIDKLEKTEKITTIIRDSEKEYKDITAKFHTTKQKYIIGGFPQKSGLYVIDTYFTTNEGKIYHTDSYAYIIRKYDSKSRLPLTIFLNKNAKIKEIKYTDTKAEILRFKEKTVSDKKIKLKLLPLTAGKLKIEYELDKEKREFYFQIIEAPKEKLSSRQKNTIKIPLTNIESIDNFKVKLTHDSYRSEKIKTKIKNGQFQVTWVPEKPGEYQIIVIDREEQKIIYNKNLWCDFENYYAGKCDVLIDVMFKKEVLKMIIDQINPDNSIDKNVKFVSEDSVKEKPKLRAIFTKKAEGIYSFIAKTEDTNMKMRSIRFYEEPELKAGASVLSTLEIPLMDFTTEEIPEECEVLMLDMNEKKEKIKIACKVKVDKEKKLALVSFLPEVSQGVYKINMKKNEKLLKEDMLLSLIPGPEYNQIYKKVVEKPIELVDFEKEDTITKAPNSILLLNLNGLKTLKSCDIKFNLENSKDPSKIVECIIGAINFGICPVEIKNAPDGEYRGVLTTEDENFVVTQKILVSKAYSPKIKIQTVNELTYENQPIELLIDTSDFNKIQLDIKDIDYGEQNISYSFNNYFRYFVFIPSISDQYTVQFIVNGTHMKEYDIHYDIKKCDPSRISIEQKTFKSYFGAPSKILVRVPENAKIFPHKIENEESITTVLRDGINEYVDCEAYFHCSKNKYYIANIPQKAGIFMISSWITSKDKKIYYLDPYIFLVKKTVIAPHTPLKLFFSKNLQLSEIEFTSKDPNQTIPYEHKIVKIESKNKQKIKILPLSEGQLKIKGIAEDKETLEFKWSVEEAKKVICHQKYTIKIPLASQNKDINTYKVKIFGENTFDEKIKKEIKDNQLKVEWIPKKRGDYNLKIIDTNDKKIILDQAVFCDYKNYIATKDDILVALKFKGETEDINIQQINPDSNKIENVKFTFDSQEKPNLIVFLKDKKPGLYTFILKTKDNMIGKIASIRVIDEPEIKCAVNTNSTLKLKLKDFIVQEIPEEGVIILQDVNETQDKIRQSCRINKDQEEAVVSFKPEKEGCYKYILKHNKTRLLSEPQYIQILSKEEYDKLYPEIFEKNIEIVDFEKKSTVTKPQNSTLLLNVNGIKYLIPDTKFVLENVDTREIIECQLGKEKAGLLPVKIKNVTNGEYCGKLISGAKYMVTQKICINDFYVPKIKVYTEDKDHYENMPVEVLVDLSDFNECELLVKGIEYGEPKIMYSFNEYLKMIAFIPSVLEKYNLHFYINGCNIAKSNLMIDIKELKDTNFPITDNSFKICQASNQMVINIPENAKFYTPPKNLKGLNIKTILLDKDHKEIIVGAEIKNEKSYCITNIPKNNGVYYISTKLSDENQCLYLDPCLMVIENRNLVAGIPSTIYLDQNENIKSIVMLNRDNSIMYREVLATKNNRTFKKVKILPLKAGNLKILTNIENDEKEYLYEVVDYDYKIPLNKKYSKIFSAPSKDYDMKSLKVNCLKDNLFRVSCEQKIKDNKIKVCFIPEKAGFYSLKVIDDDEKEILVDETYVCDTEIYYLVGKNIDVKIDYAKGNEEMNVMLINPDFSIVENIPFTIQYRLIGKPKRIKISFNPVEKGVYTFVFKSEGKIMDFKSIRIVIPSLRKCVANHLCALDYPMYELNTPNLPETCQLHMKHLYNKKMNKLRYTAKIEIDEKKSFARFIFKPEIEGVYTLEVKNDSLKILPKNEVQVLSKDEYLKLYEKLYEDIPSEKTHRISKTSGLRALDELDLNNCTLELMKDEVVIASSDISECNNTIVVKLPPIHNPEDYKIKIKDKDGEFFMVTNYKDLMIKAGISEAEQVNEDIQKTLPEMQVSQEDLVEVFKDTKTEHEFDDVDEYQSKVRLFVSNPKRLFNYKEIQNKVTDGHQNPVTFHVTEIDNNISQIEFMAKNNTTYKIEAQSGDSKIELFNYKHKKVDESLNDVPFGQEATTTLFLDEKVKNQPLDWIEKNCKIVCIKNDKYEEIPAKIDSIDETMKIKFVPKEIDDYQFLLVKDDSVVGSTIQPINCVYISEINDEKIYLRGDGIKFAEYQKENKFEIISKKRIKMSTIHIETDNYPVNFKKSRKSATCIQVTYSPDFIGSFAIYIRMGDKFLKDCPISINVVYDGQKNKDNDVISNLKEVKFVVCRKMKEAMPSLECVIYNESGLPAPCHLTLDNYDEDKNVSEMKCCFIAQNPGLHNLKIKNPKDKEFKDIDLKILVEPWESDKEKVKIIGKVPDMIKEGDYLKIFMSCDKEYSREDIVVKVHGPQNGVCECIRVGDRVILALWMASMIGDYHVSISILTEKCMYGYQKNFKVVSNEEIDNMEKLSFFTSGNGIYGAIIDYPNVFQIYSEKFLTEDVAVEITNNSSIELEKYTKTFNNKSTTTVLYSVIEEGDFAINLTYKGKHISNSPFIVHASKNTPMILPVTCSLGAKTVARANRIFEFTVDAIKCPESWIHFDIFSVDFKHRIKPKILELHNGILSVSFKTPYKKTYMVKITNRGYEIGGSPFKIQFK